MSTEVFSLSTIAFLAFFHTAIGPDHYVPFIALSRSARWSTGKTFRMTALCGLGHVASSVAIGLIGLVFGVTLESLEWLNGVRGDIAAWLLMGFGGAYIILAIFQRGHSHQILHRKGRKPTAWILFIIFVFGPCEVLIPMMMYYGVKNDITTMVTGAILFGAVTIFTMLGIVLFSLRGMKFIRLPFLAYYSHLITGFIIFLAGVGIRFFGL